METQKEKKLARQLQCNIVSKMKKKKKKTMVLSYIKKRTSSFNKGQYVGQWHVFHMQLIINSSDSSFSFSCLQNVPPLALCLEEGIYGGMEREVEGCRGEKKTIIFSLTTGKVGGRGEMEEWWPHPSHLGRIDGIVKKKIVRTDWWKSKKLEVFNWTNLLYLCSIPTKLKLME